MSATATEDATPVADSESMATAKKKAKKKQAASTAKKKTKRATAKRATKSRPAPRNNRATSSSNADDDNNNTATSTDATNKPTTAARKPENAAVAGRRIAPPRKRGDFIPSEAQVRTLGVFLAAGDEVSIREMCSRSNVDPSTFYRWMQRPDFRRWWNDATESVLRGARSGVLAALTKRAEQGDLSAIKVWLQRFDRVEAGDRQSLQDLYRELIRRFATDEYLVRLRNERSANGNDDDNDDKPRAEKTRRNNDDDNNDDHEHNNEPKQQPLRGDTDQPA